MIGSYSVEVGIMGAYRTIHGEYIDVDIVANPTNIILEVNSTVTNLIKHRFVFDASEFVSNTVSFICNGDKYIINVSMEADDFVMYVLHVEVKRMPMLD